MEFSRPEYWSREPFPSPGDLPNIRIEPRSPGASEKVDLLLWPLQDRPAPPSAELGPARGSTHRAPRAGDLGQPRPVLGVWAPLSSQAPWRPAAVQVRVTNGSSPQSHCLGPELMLAGALASRSFFCCFSSKTVVSAILFKVYFNVRNLARIRYPFPKSSPFSLLLPGGVGGFRCQSWGERHTPSHTRRGGPGSWVRGVLRPD